jgi:CDP-paratose 2-epimerase
MTAICEDITGNKISIASVSENRPADLRIYISDNSLIEAEISWKPVKTVRNVFEDIYTWIKDNEASLKPLLS